MPVSAFHAVLGVSWFCFASWPPLYPPPFPPSPTPPKLYTFHICLTENVNYAYTYNHGTPDWHAYTYNYGTLDWLFCTRARFNGDCLPPVSGLDEAASFSEEYAADHNGMNSSTHVAAGVCETPCPTDEMWDLNECACDEHGNNCSHQYIYTRPEPNPTVIQSGRIHPRGLGSDTTS